MFKAAEPIKKSTDLVFKTTKHIKNSLETVPFSPKY
jgi:hypothetical protein